MSSWTRTSARAVTQEIGENQFSAEIGQFYGSTLLDSAATRQHNSLSRSPAPRAVIKFASIGKWQLVRVEFEKYPT